MMDNLKMKRLMEIFYLSLSHHWALLKIYLVAQLDWRLRTFRRGERNDLVEATGTLNMVRKIPTAYMLKSNLVK